MGWPIWVIVLIPVAISILSLLFKPPREEIRRGPRPRPNFPPGPQGPARPPARRSISDIDQFLEEINRRRREAAAKRRATEPGAGPALPPPVIEERPAPPPPRPRPVPPLKPPPSRRIEREPPPRPRVVREEVIVAEVVAPPPGVEVPPPPPPPPPPEEMPPPPVLGRVAPKVQSPVLAEVLSLLRSPQGIRKALVLREILDRPLARRRSRSPFRRS